MVLVQKWPLFQLFFLGNIGQKKVFYDILEQKKAFLSYKRESSKRRKIDIFPKGLSYGFGPKMAIFLTFLFRQYRPRQFLLQYFRTKKTPFQAIKTRTSKSRKIDIFPKGLSHGFGPKMAIFPTFILRKYGAVKCLLAYSTTKKRLSKL